MPYLFKLSERREKGWIEAVIFLAWYVSDACRKKNVENPNVHFYLVRKTTHSVRVGPSSRDSNSNSLYIKSNTTNITNHIYPGEYFTEDAIKKNKLGILGRMVDDEFLTVLHYKMENREISRKEILAEIKKLPKYNPIRKIMTYFFPNIEDLYIHITCKQYYASIRNKGLHSQAHIDANSYLKTINNNDLDTSVTADEQEVTNASGITKNKRKNKRKNKKTRRRN
jgi:hypothetical protein